jgi:Flp pilus assembly protein TadD
MRALYLRLAIAATGTLALTGAMTAVTARYAHAEAEDDLRDGDKYFEEGEWRKAAASFDRAIRKSPGQVSAEAYGKRAAVYIILKDYKGGLEFIEKQAKVRYPNAPEVLEQQALILWETGAKNDAIVIAEKVVAAKPKAFTNQKLIGEFYAGRDFAKTAAAYESYLANRPEDLEPGDVLPRVRLGFAYLGTARAALAEGDEAKAQSIYAKSVDQFELVQRKHKQRANAQVNSDNGLCAAYTGLGRYDQAITVCERVIQDPRHVDTNGSVWFNLATSYLANHQTKKARSIAEQFTRVRKNEARGYLLIGDTFFQDRDWGNALDQYLRAEKLLKANQGREQVQLSIRLGKTYRRLPAPSSGPNPNLNLAIEKLSAGVAANPNSFELSTELGGAYIEAKQDVKATQLTDRMMASADFAKAAPEGRAAVLTLAAKAQFNQHKLKEARQRFEAASQLKQGDVSIQRGLVDTINQQAFEALAKDPKGAQAYLDQALPIDPASPTTITNLAVLQLDRGDCDGAQKQLAKLKDARGNDQLYYERLLARTYLCASKPDPKKASELYAAAEKSAKKAQATQLVAEIDIEWAPLLWDTDLNDAVEKLQSALSAGAQVPELAAAAKRNLALGLYRRGWKYMRDNKVNEAVADFEKATRDPSALRGTEPLAFDFSYALALLDTGRSAEAAKIFKNLSAKGNQAAYLKPPYAKVGTQFFGAYANYRSGTVASRQQAVNDFTKLQADASGTFAAKVKTLIASSWELIAYDAWKSGNAGGAAKALTSAVKFADDEFKRRVNLDRAVLSLGKDQLATLEGLNGAPPEALLNVGIVYDQMGRAKDAYDAWVKAKAKNVQSRDLQKWIDAKKRIYGF